MKIKIHKLSAFFILLSSILLGVEATIRDNESVNRIFDAADILIVVYFTFEIIFRLWNVKHGFTDFLLSIKNKIIVENKFKKEDVLEEWIWIVFDLLLVILSLLSFFRHFFDHPQLIFVFRMFRILRIFRLFELSSTLKAVEKKIVSVIPTIIIFFFLIGLILYTYSIVGMHLYNYNKFETIDFSDVYSAMTSLFILMTNGWSDILSELRSFDSVPQIVTDLYVISFFILSVIITLNVFLAVMTSQVQERLERDLKQIKKTEEEIQTELAVMEKENEKDNVLILQKIEQIIKELDFIKKSTNSGPNSKN